MNNTQGIIDRTIIDPTMMRPSSSDEHWRLRVLSAPDPSELIRGFGPHAERWARGLAPTQSTVLADEHDSARALDEAARRRRQAGFVATGPLLDEPRSTIVRRLAAEVVGAVVDRAERRKLFDALASSSISHNGVAQSAMTAIDENVRLTLRDLYLLGDVLVVRSRSQARTLSSIFGRIRSDVLVAPVTDPDVPVPKHRDRAATEPQVTIVIWAPYLAAVDVTILLYALSEFQAEIVVICAGGSVSFPGVRLASLTDAATELRRAALIIDAALSDPASALALAAWEVPLVVSSTSGADEFLNPVCVYDPWNWRSVLAAVSAGRAAAAPQTTAKPTPPAVALARKSQPVDIRPAGGPPVTIIVPTFNRPDVLPLALASLEAQQHCNLDILVINDAGISVNAIVARFPRARCVDNDRNCGLFATLNRGIALANGQYVGFLADDDVYYPDHVHRLVTALEAAHALVGHANALTRFLAADARGDLYTVGHQVLFGGHLDTTEMLWSGSQTTQAVLLRHDVFTDAGVYDVSLIQADYEFLVRLSRRYDFVHVDHVTCEFRYRIDGSTMSHTAGTDAIVEGLQEIFARYPSGSDPLVEHGRAEAISFVRSHHGTQYWKPALILAPQNLMDTSR